MTRAFAKDPGRNPGAPTSLEANEGAGAADSGVHITPGLGLPVVQVARSAGIMESAIARTNAAMHELSGSMRHAGSIVRELGASFAVATSGAAEFIDKAGSGSPKVRDGFSELNSAIEDLTMLFRAFLSPALYVAADALRGITSWINELMQSYPVLSKYLGFAVAGFLGAGLAGSFLTEKLAKLRGVWSTLRPLLVGLRLGGLVRSFLGFGRALFSLAVGVFPIVIGGIKSLHSFLVGLRLGGLVRGFVGLGGVLRLLAVGVFPIVTGAIKALGLALLTTPVGWVMAAIAAIAGAAYLIYEYWEPIKEFLVGLWESIKPYWEAFAGWIGDLFGPVFDWVAEKFGWLAKVASKVVEWLGPGGGDSDAPGPGRLPPARGVPDAGTGIGPAAGSAPAGTPGPGIQAVGQTNNVMINVPGAGDPEAVARAVKKEMDRATGPAYPTGDFADAAT